MWYVYVYTPTHETLDTELRSWIILRTLREQVHFALEELQRTSYLSNNDETYLLSEKPSRHRQVKGERPAYAYARFREVEKQTLNPHVLLGYIINLCWRSLPC